MLLYKRHFPFFFETKRKILNIKTTNKFNINF